ncbi:MAG: mechanosensitive ion channel, partial [Elusimicrobiaceae bacterium]|nr:mechanosensitive ion channel [Elusimicrobiaceae bacterium]
MLYAIINRWLSAITFLSDKERMVCSELLAILLLGVFVYAVAKLVKFFLHLLLEREFIQRRWPRLFEAVKSSHILGMLGYALSAVVVIHLSGFFVPTSGAILQRVLMRVIGIYSTICFMMVLVSGINVVDYLYGRNPNVPLRGVFQAVKIVLYLLAALIIVSIVISKEPMYVITGLSAAAAVFMLIFKDPILGFAAGIQLASNKLLKIGDWITMPSHGADGTVIDITLTTVRVQNFDNTIINVPAYDLVSQPFQNWNGMLQSGARRIRRAIYVDVETIQFLDEEMFKRLSKIKLISEYLKNKSAEIKAFNAEHNVKESVLNGRHLTNIGTFRQYALEYLRSLPTIDHRQTCMVRQLDAGAAGLPMEIYCFTSTTDWVKYEGIQSDIFDHLYSVMPQFGLYPFQQPTGR